MKIVEQTHDKLVLRARPVLLAVLCLALGCMFLLLDYGMRSLMPASAAASGISEWSPISGLGLLSLSSALPFGAALLILSEKRVVFDRNAGRITLASRGILGRRERIYPLAGLQEAVLATSRINEGGVAYRAVLKFSDAPGQVPLTYFYTGGNGGPRAVEAINAWLGCNADGSIGAVDRGT